MPHIDLIHRCGQWGSEIPGVSSILQPTFDWGWRSLSLWGKEGMGVSRSLSSLSWANHGPSSLGNHSYVYWFIQQTIQYPFWTKHSPQLAHVNLQVPDLQSLSSSPQISTHKMWIGCFFLPDHIFIWHWSLATSHCLIPTLLPFHPADWFAGLSRLLTSLPLAPSLGEYRDFLEPGHRWYVFGGEGS